MASAIMNLSPNLIKLSLACSRCKNSKSISCSDDFHVTVHCIKNSSFSGSIKEITHKSQGCPFYEEDMQQLISCLQI